MISLDEILETPMMKAIIALREIRSEIVDADVIKLFKDITFQQEYPQTWIAVMRNIHGSSADEFINHPQDPLFTSFYKFIKNVVSRELNEREIAFEEIGYYFPNSGRSIFGLSLLLSKSLIRSDQAKNLYKLVLDPKFSGEELEEIILRSNVLEDQESSELDNAISIVLKENQKAVDEFKSGKDKALNSLIGQVMKIVKGNPQEIVAKMKEQIK